MQMCDGVSRNLILIFATVSGVADQSIQDSSSFLLVFKLFLELLIANIGT